MYIDCLLLKICCKSFRYHPQIKNRYREVASSNDVSLKMKFGQEVETYLRDLKFMSHYIQGFLEYLEYDSTYWECYKRVFNKKYDILEFLHEPYEVQKQRNKEIVKIVKKEIRKLKWE